jgi:hypothetical protein
VAREEPLQDYHSLKAISWTKGSRGYTNQLLYQDDFSKAHEQYFTHYSKEISGRQEEPVGLKQNIGNKLIDK